MELQPTLTLYKLTQQLSKELKQNKDLYEQFLPIDEIEEILRTPEKIYFPLGTHLELVEMLIDFISYCQKEASGDKSLNTSFSQRFLEELPEKWQKIREPTFHFNKDQLRVLSYLLEKLNSGVYANFFHLFDGHLQHFDGTDLFQGNFQYLKFDFPDEEVLKVAQNAKQMASYDLKSFFFLSGYLLKCCYNMENNEKSLSEIIQKYETVIKKLGEKYRPAPQIEAEQNELDENKSFKNEELVPKISINLKPYQGQKEKEKALNDFIMERAKESMEQYNKFNSIIKKICYKNNGFRFKSGVKIRDMKQKSALLRIKEKMLSNIYQQKNKEKIKQTNTSQDGVKKSIKEAVTNEIIQYEET